MTSDEYRSISAAAKKLLQSNESTHLDFKETVASVSGEDFVAFANTKGGGVLLIGVCEKSGSKPQTKIVGCTYDDKAKLSLLQKANSCRPPVPISIITENLRVRPFLRVLIPESRHKPHCTEKGVYKVRKGARNQALVPEQLLELFLDMQAKVFVERFAEASATLKTSLDEVQTHVHALSGLVFSEITDLADQIERQLSGISAMADQTTDLAADAQADNQTVLDSLQEIDRKFDYVIEGSRHNFMMLDQITEHLNLDSIKRLNDKRSIKIAFRILSTLPNGQNDKDALLKLMKKKNLQMSSVVDSFPDSELTEMYESAKNVDRPR